MFTAMRRQGAEIVKPIELNESDPNTFNVSARDVDHFLGSSRKCNRCKEEHNNGRHQNVQ